MKGSSFGFLQTTPVAAVRCFSPLAEMHFDEDAIQIMNGLVEHITVCICTYKRPHFLKQVLEHLAFQVTKGQFTFSIVVADNDQLQSAKDVVSGFARASGIPIQYCCESRQNIALTRNKAIENARGEYVAFLDDDEVPTDKWLLSLYNACRKYGVDGVLGSARPQFEGKPPEWVVKGKFFDRVTHPTGFVIDWRMGRTGNVLLKSHLFNDGEQPFRSEFLSGEDQDFFRRMTEKGHAFVWCNEALTHEIIPAVRCTRSYLLKRGLFYGKFNLKHPSSGPFFILKSILKSVVAVTVYTIALPCLLLLGQHIFMRYLFKTCHHVGKLLMFFGVDPIKNKTIARMYNVMGHETATPLGG